MFISTVEKVTRGLSRGTRRDGFLPSVVALRLGRGTLTGKRERGVTCVFGSGKTVGLVNIVKGSGMVIGIGGIVRTGHVTEGVAGLQAKSGACLNITTVSRVGRFTPAMRRRLGASNIVGVGLVGCCSERLGKLLVESFRGDYRSGNVGYIHYGCSDGLVTCEKRKVAASRLAFLGGFRNIRSVSSVPVVSFRRSSVRCTRSISVGMPRSKIGCPLMKILSSKVTEVPRLAP